MPVKDDMLRYGELVLESMAARALLFVGDLDEALHMVRRAFGRMVAALPRSQRAIIAGTVGASARRIEEWTKAANAWDAEHPDQEEKSFRLNSRAGRIYFTAMAYLMEAGDEYRSLGAIADHVKGTLREKVATMEVWRQLDAYVRLSILEQHPADPDLYRLKVRPVRWKESTKKREFREQLMASILTETFSLGFQTVMAAPGALARHSVYQIREDQVEDFVEKQQALQNYVQEQLDAYEELLRKKASRAPWVLIDDIYLAGPRVDDPLGSLNSPGTNRESARGSDDET